MADKSEKRKKVGLALGGGGARGLAHIGVIKILEQAGIPIDFIAGTSMGALVGGWYAATKDIKTLENIFLTIKKRDIFSVPSMIINKKEDPFKSKSIADLILKTLNNKTIESCSIPFKAIATEVESGEEVILESGSLIEIIKASSALPILFKPIRIKDKILMDGGFVNSTPADVAKKMGADIVIAVDVSKGWINFTTNSINIKNAYSMISDIIDGLVYQVSKQKLQIADIILRPPVFNYESLSFNYAKEIISAGERKTKEYIKEIQQKTGYYKEIPKTFLERIIDFILTD